MMVLGVILILIFLLLIYVLVAPIVLFINTNANTYYIHFKGLAKASIEEDKKELLRVKLKVLFFNFTFFPLKKNRGPNKPKEVKNKQLKKSNSKIRLKTGLRLLKSFKVKKLYLNVDTGDCISNAKLYPVFALFNYKRGGFNINFEGKNQLVLHIQSRSIDIIKSFINI